MSDERVYRAEARARIKQQQYDPLIDLRPRNAFARRLREMLDQSETAIRNAEETADVG